MKIREKSLIVTRLNTREKYYTKNIIRVPFNDVDDYRSNANRILIVPYRVGARLHDTPAKMSTGAFSYNNP